jgi:uncharacterized protein involved in exopolysaccharide biosynthesis
MGEMELELAQNKRQTAKLSARLEEAHRERRELAAMANEELEQVKASHDLDAASLQSQISSLSSLLNL